MKKDKLELLIKLANDYKNEHEQEPFADEYIALAESALNGDQDAKKRLDDEENNVLDEVFTDLNFGCLWT